MKPKPLTAEDFAPCMECGSVQCAVCSDKLWSAKEWAYDKLSYNCEFGFSPEYLKKILDKAFGGKE